MVHLFVSPVVRFDAVISSISSALRNAALNSIYRYPYCLSVGVRGTGVPPPGIVTVFPELFVIVMLISFPDSTKIWLCWLALLKMSNPSVLGLPRSEKINEDIVLILFGEKKEANYKAGGVNSSFASGFSCIQPSINCCGE